MRTLFRSLTVALVLTVVSGCASRKSAPAQASAPDAASVPDAAVTGRPADAIIVAAAGDIAGKFPNDEATAKLLDTLRPDAVLPLGDLAYPYGTPAEFEQFYTPTWGRHRTRTLPTPGNHDHATAGLAGYCAYFGEKAGCRGGNAWYAVDLGAWRILSLDSGAHTPGSPMDPMVEGSPQRKWLDEELAQNKRRCTLAIWHHPRFSSGSHGEDVRSQGVWEALHRAGVDLVLNGHDHHYERFGPMNPRGERDDGGGITQFIVGTGGAPLYALATAPHPQTQARQSSVHGVLELRLLSDAFEWRFHPIEGQVFQDFGRAACH